MKGFSLLFLAASLVAVSANPKEAETTSCELEAKMTDGVMDYYCGEDDNEISVPSSIVEDANATCGDTLTFATSEISDMALNDGADVKASTPSSIASRSAANGPRGIATVLVVRLEDRFGEEPTASRSKLENDFFDDSASLESQMDDCSYGKFKIRPFRGFLENNIFVDNGVVDVRMNNFDIDIPGNYRDAARQAAIGRLGRIGTDFGIDFIVYCYPEGNQGFKYGANGKKDIYLTDPYCSYVSYQMNTLGWNLGLGQSGVENDSSSDERLQGDGTGEMGFPLDGDNVRRCFNPAKSFQLGWYDNTYDDYDPLDPKWDDEYEFILNGVADYKRALENDNYVSIRLRQWDRTNDGYWYVRDYYVGYNRKSGIHEDTAEDENEVTIVQKIEGGPFVRGRSRKIASLEVLQGYQLKQFTSSSGQINVEFTGLENGDRDAVVKIKRVSSPFVTSSPKPSTTKRPTKRPSSSNTKKPTRRPTERPTKRPTRRPTQRPTSSF